MHTKKFVLGITGSIASGKTLLCKILFDKGFFVINADDIVKQLSQKNGILYNKIVNLCKEYKISEAIDSDYNINKSIIRNNLFNNQQFKKDIEKIIHPLVKQEISRLIQNSVSELIAVEVPLLFEVKLESMFNKILCIYLSETKIIKNLIERYKINTTEAQKIINSQTNIIEKIIRSDYIILNSKDINVLKTKITKLVKHIKEEQNMKQ